MSICPIIIRQNDKSETCRVSEQSVDSVFPTILPTTTAAATTRARTTATAANAKIAMAIICIVRVGWQR